MMDISLLCEEIDVPCIEIFSIEAEDGLIVTTFLCDNNNPLLLDWEYIVNKDLKLTPIDVVVREYTKNRGESMVVTSDFWTCKCKENFIRHNKCEVCSACGTKREENTRRCIYLNDIIPWKPSETVAKFVTLH